MNETIRHDTDDGVKNKEIQREFDPRINFKLANERLGFIKRDIRNYMTRINPLFEGEWEQDIEKLLNAKNSIEAHEIVQNIIASGFWKDRYKSDPTAKLIREKMWNIVNLHGDTISNPQNYTPPNTPPPNMPQLKSSLY